MKATLIRHTLILNALQSRVVDI